MGLDFWNPNPFGNISPAVIFLGGGCALACLFLNGASRSCGVLSLKCLPLVHLQGYRRHGLPGTNAPLCMKRLLDEEDLKKFTR